MGQTQEDVNKELYSKRNETAIKEFANHLKTQKTISKYDIKLGRSDLFLSVKYLDQDGKWKWTNTSEDSDNFKLTVKSFEDKIPIGEKRKYEQTPQKDDERHKKPALNSPGTSTVEDMDHGFKG